ncbi:MAG: 50S ribosomal protein L6 [Bacteroidetes bacterium HGW-Bacteroidetes-6]|jgi:large subunit ribosomal protein L6|nr:MAG: 50S ribosomal protein L6 [Bacteroidetes bacterium HGW-Bacteroidetes-6]
MSRIGKKIIDIPTGVQVNISAENLVSVKGPKGELKQQIAPEIKVNVENNVMTIERINDEKQVRSYHGLYRSLLANMVQGVSEGFTAKLELIGVGYKCSNNGQLLDLSLGHSHNILFEIPGEVKVETLTEKGKAPLITLTSFDKQLLGQVASKIRSFRKPEPYKGKGVKFVGEVLRRKAGKAAASK